jgi:pyruvate formate lyase activating enzyme
MVDGKVCWDESICEQCDTCIKVCPHLASPKILTMSSDEVIDKLKEVSAFVRGITVSGGECMMHPDFLKELFVKVKTLNMTALIDSNGFVRFEDHPDLMEVCDGVMLDVKATDPKFHQQLAKYDNSAVLKNLQYLLSIEKLTEVRIVCLPRFDEQNRKTIEDVISIVGDQARIKLIRYRPYGVRQEGLDILGSASLDEDLFLEYKRYALSLGAGEVISV